MAATVLHGLEATTLVLITLVLGLPSTNVDGPGHQAKNVCREKTQPLLLLGCEGCGKRLPCVGQLFELSRPLSQCVGAVTHNIDNVTVTLIALPPRRQTDLPPHCPVADSLFYSRPEFCLLRRELQCRLDYAKRNPTILRIVGRLR